MSATNRYRHRECEQCRTIRPATSLIKGRFCSDECWREHQHLQALADEYDVSVYLCTYCSGPRADDEDDDDDNEDPDHDLPSTVEGSFCSFDCWYRHKGRKAIDQIESDHRWCSTCFRKIKSILRPGPLDSVDVEGPDHKGREDSGPKDVLVGWQFQTEHTERAIDEQDLDAYRRIERSRWGCVCGTVDCSDPDDILDAVDTATTITSLYRCLCHLHTQGVFDDPPDKERLFDALKTEWRDWEYAVGRALYDPG